MDCPALLMLQVTVGVMELCERVAARDPEATEQARALAALLGEKVDSPHQCRSISGRSAG